MKENELAHARHKQHIPLAVIYTVLAALCFSLMSLMGKLIGEQASTDTVLFARYVVSLVLILPWVIKNPRDALRVSQPMKLMTRSALTLLALGCFFYALRFISLGDALVLNNTFPLFIPLIAWAFHRIRTPHKMWIGIVLGFFGVVLVLRPGPQFFHAASLIGLASGAFGAFSFIVIRFMTKAVPLIQILFYNFFICFLITGLLLPFGWTALSERTLVLLLGVGVFGFAYQYFSTLFLAKASVRITSPLMYLCIVFGVAADYLIWEIVPGAWSIAGMLCIIAGGILTIFFGQKEIRPDSFK